MRVDLENGWLIHYSGFLKNDEANSLFDHFMKNTPWEDGAIRIFGKTVPIPRKEAFFSLNGESYGYSGKRLENHRFTPELKELLKKIRSIYHHPYNSVLINLYRDGNDSNGWHADNEKELGKDPVIASVSLGASRSFDLKHNLNGRRLRFELNNGDLLIMGGELQHFWKHQIPKRKMITSPRINLTFRNIV